MNLCKMRLQLAIADLSTLPEMLSKSDLAELKAWIRKDPTGIPAQVRDLIEQTLHIAAQGE